MIDAVDANDRVAQLTRLTQRLTDMLAVEAAAFEAHRAQDVAGQTEEMVRLANVYRHESIRLKADPGLIAEAAPAAREKLVVATQTFEAVLARHGRAVAAAKEVAEGMVQAIVEEVAATRTARAPYGSTARVAAPDASAIALNKTA
jgi:hypothetical protein